jgi:CRP-like cAMP-binding protein
MMSPALEPLVARLSRSFLFAGAAREIVAEFVATAHLKSLKKGEFLFMARDPADALYFLVDGWIKLARLSRQGEEIIINVVAPGETFAEAAVFGAPGSVYPVNAQAAEESTVLAIGREKFIARIEASPEFSLGLLSAISVRQHFLIRQIEQIAARSAPQRIGAFLLDLSRRREGAPMAILDLPYDKSLIAGRLNIQPETFSRALAKLEPVGVKVEGKTITLSNLEALKEFCDCEET